MNKDIYIMGIETSCDETSVAIVKNGREVLSNIISSQINIHKKYGGVVPEIASRKHIENIKIVTDEAIKKSKIKIEEIDSIAVTYGPGLVGALLVGLSFAKGLSISLNKPYIGINHIEGHIASNYISHKDLEPPFINLIISGGHTNLIVVKDYNKYIEYGKTHDDAVGECYDKIARVLGFPYPGGPKLEMSALKGKNIYDYPVIKIEDNKYDFSYSGLKSHFLNIINTEKMKNNDILDNDTINNISCSFQNAIIDTLVDKCIELSNETNINKIAICGGVSANNAIKLAFKNKCNENNILFYSPEIYYTTDNAAMIATAGYYKFINGEKSDMNLNAIANLEF